MFSREGIGYNSFVRATYEINEKKSGWKAVDHIRDLVSSKIKIMKNSFQKQNLVVNQGRSNAARMLTQGFDRHISLLQLGDCVKSSNLPTLLDSGVAREIRKLDGTPQATFLIDQGAEVFLPAAARRYPLPESVMWGVSGAVTIDGNGVTTLTVGSLDFASMGIQWGDQVIFNSPSLVPVALSVKRVLSPTELELHNPYGFTSANVTFRISSPGTQVLFSKLITASNHFPAADYGPFLIIHEASWLFNDGSAWNRVVFNHLDDASGVLIQPADAFGVEIGVRFELLVTF